MEDMEHEVAIGRVTLAVNELPVSDGQRFSEADRRTAHSVDDGCSRGRGGRNPL